jgi:hypothetical protein
MTEKLFSLVVCVVLIATLAACGSLSREKAAEPNPIDVEPVPEDSLPGGAHIVTLDSGTTMRVLWTISGYTIGKGATWGEQEAKAFLFKPLDINDTEIIFDGQACQGVSFQEETVNATEYLSSVWQVTPQTLGIDVQELQVFKTNCSLPGFQEYMRLDDGRLIVPIHGVFFFFEPARNY